MEIIGIAIACFFGGFFSISRFAMLGNAGFVFLIALLLFMLALVGVWVYALVDVIIGEVRSLSRKDEKMKLNKMLAIFVLAVIISASCVGIYYLFVGEKNFEGSSGYIIREPIGKNEYRYIGIPSREYPYIGIHSQGNIVYVGERKPKEIVGDSKKGFVKLEGGGTAYYNRFYEGAEATLLQVNTFISNEKPSYAIFSLLSDGKVVPLDSWGSIDQIPGFTAPIEWKEITIFETIFGEEVGNTIYQKDIVSGLPILSSKFDSQGDLVYISSYYLYDSKTQKFLANPLYGDFFSSIPEERRCDIEDINKTIKSCPEKNGVVLVFHKGEEYLGVHLVSMSGNHELKLLLGIEKIGEGRFIKFNEKSVEEKEIDSQTIKSLVYRHDGEEILRCPLKSETIKKEATKIPTPEEKGIPGFEAVFAIAGLLVVAYLLRRRK